jgi:pyridoxal 5'-phosphate synthase pdxT subunit
VKIGVLAMQGAFVEHEKVLKSLGIEVIEVRKPEDLDDLDGLIIPGGESTTIGKMLDRYGLLQPIREKGEAGFPLFGTCAGMILLSKNIEEGMTGQPVLGLLDVVTSRNAFGRQLESFEADIEIPELGNKPFHGIFIRAPLIRKVSEKVKVLGKLKEGIVAVREGNILAAAFHPELTEDARFHEYFIRMIREDRKQDG